MTTVVIIGVVAAMAAPRMQKAFERSRFRSVVTDINQTLRLARSYAITNKVQFGVCFDPNTMTVTLFKDLINPAGYDFVTGDSILRCDTLPPEFVWMGTDVSNNVVAFQPNGAAGFTGGGNIFSLANSTDLVALSATNVLASTGRVQSSFACY